jgi:hypothetical protein
MIGRDGVFTPLLKRLREASLEGELNTHLETIHKNKTTGETARSEKTCKAL